MPLTHRNFWLLDSFEAPAASMKEDKLIHDVSSWGV